MDATERAGTEEAEKGSRPPAAAVIESALGEGRTTLSEYESKIVLAAYGVPVVEERLCSTAEEARRAAEEIGYPVAVKACSPDITHKTERGLVALGLMLPEGVQAAFENFQRETGWGVSVVVQRMVKGRREFLAGMKRDETFGPCVLFGVGGIMTEVLRDVSFRVAPLTLRDAREMMSEIKSSALLDEFRGAVPVDRGELAAVLLNLGRIGMELPRVREIDINPLVIEKGHPVAVDALMVLGGNS
ncbi:MAG: acetate--CoA ligase family protein [bacterium]